LWSVWTTPRNVMTLDIVPDEQALLGAMARKRRQHISTAAKKHVTADVARGLAGLRTVHALLAEHGAREGFPVAAWQHYEALHELFDAEQALGFVLGRVRGEIVGAALGLRFGAGACLMYAVTTPAARSLPVGDLMHWQWIRWARAAGCRTIDFGATCTGIPPVPSHPNYGIYRFKTELGARLTMTTGYYDTVYAPLRYRAARALERRLLPQARRAAIAVQRALRGPQDEAAPAPAATHEAVTCA
jgi:lipid II:glycine glycyltransferase (peptidoglycan interpeptide bridge formation enzyme)